MSCKANPSEPGFTLIEMVVALAILAMVLGALFQSFSSGLRTMGVAEQHLKAALIAESTLARYADRNLLLEPGETGETDGFGWSAQVTPMQDEDLPQPPDVPWQAYRVDVTVSWPPGRSIRLSSVRLGAPP